MYLRILGRMIRLIGFEILRFVHGAAQSVTWRLNGVLGEVQNAKRPERYDRCAQVLAVHLFYSFDPMVFASRRNFVCSHDRFESPRYVIENDHVTLLDVDDEYAVFAEAKDRDAQLWKMEYSGFMKLAQLRHCNRLILVPRGHFRRMSDAIGDPVPPVIFLFSVGRCGSTLLTQILESTGRCVSISEPAPLLYVANKLMAGGKEDPDGLRSTCRDTLRWICRPCPSVDPLAYFVKVAPSCSLILPVVFDVFPSSTYLFMYRNVVDVAESFCKVIGELPFLFVMNAAAKRSAYLRRRFLTMFDMRDVFDSSGAAWTDLILGAVGFAKVCQLYVESRRNGGLPISAIRYEDLRSDPEHAIRRTFEFCRLPSSLVAAAVRDGLTADAQRNSPLSMSNLRRGKKTGSVAKFDEDTKRFVNAILRQTNLPLIGEDCLLEGTITNK